MTKIEVIDRVTGEVVDVIDCRDAYDADKVERGMKINMDIDRYRTRQVHIHTEPTDDKRCN